MKSWFLLFVWLPILVQADWEGLFSEDENPCLFHHVQVISGHLNFSLQEIVQGARPIPLIRAYSSGGALERNCYDSDLLLRDVHKGWMVQGGWSFLSHTDLFIIPACKQKDFKAYLAEPGGSMITYKYSHREGKHVLFLKPTGSFPTFSGKLGARNNPQNNLLRLDLNKGIVLLFLPDGGTREYRGESFDESRGGCDPRNQCFYRLIKEVFPDAHQFLYKYDKRSHLSEIKSSNLANTKVYATVNFTLSTSPLRLSAVTSDGKDFFYRSLEAEEREYLYKMESLHAPPEVASFIPGRKGIGHRMLAMNIAGRELFRAHYHVPTNKKEERDWDKKPHHKPLPIDKVKILEEPVGANGEMVAVARFSYEPNCTEVRDAENLMIRYRHDGEKLNQIEYFDENNRLSSIQKFFWDSSRLRCKVLLDTQGTPLLAQTFAYDEIGNVVEEGLWGDLSGRGIPLVLDEKGMPTGEGCRKWYAYLSHFNVPIWEREEDGLIYKYEYLQGTNLPSAKFTCDGESIVKREFWGYDADHLLIYEIVDDGSSIDRNNCSNVAARNKKDYILDPQSGLPVEIRETYWDSQSAQDQLLRSTCLEYSPAKNVVAEHIYDATGVYRYTLHTEYDLYGRVLRKTTPLGQENIYQYDARGDLIASKEIGLEKRFSYDALGRQIACEDVRAGTRTYTSYDTKGRTLSQIDAKGNSTSNTYDGFGHCIQTQFPQVMDEIGDAYTPSVRFAYDLQGNLASTQMPNGDTTQISYTSYRKSKQIIRPDGSRIHHIYNKNGSLAQTIHPDGSEEHFAYDCFLRVTSKQLYAANHELLSCESWKYSTFALISHTDPRGLTTTFSYDGAGRKIEERAEGRIITYQYDALGFLERVDNGITACVEIHDIGGRIIEQWEEDVSGRIENVMTFVYDEQNLKKEARRRTSQGEAYDFFSHDIAGRLIHHTDPEENVTLWNYDETFQNDLGQRVLQKTLIDALGNRTIETQDAAGRVVACEKQDCASRTLSKEAFFYDRSGNRAKRVTTVYAQDRPIRQTTSSWLYDVMGRVVQEIEADKKITQFAYDAKGHLIWKRLPSGITFTYAYDGAERLIELRSSDHSVHYQYFYGYGPDPVCILDCIHNFTLERSCNAFGQVVYEKGALILSWSYDAQGRCNAFTLPDGSLVAYTYSGSHLASVQRRSQKHNYEHLYLEFDENGHVLKEQLIGALGTIQTMHDILERPFMQSSSFLQHTVVYGPTGLINNIQNNLFGQKQYEHDALSQIKKENDLAYSFDSLGNPTDCRIGHCNEMLGTSQCTISYDLDGNPIERMENGRSIKYRYDALGRLIEIAEPDQTTRYVYDPLSRLRSRETPEGTVFFLYDQEKEIGTVDEQGHIRELKILGLGLKGDIGAAVALEIESEVFAPLHDLGGNLIAIVNARGQIVETYDMDAFGNAQSNTQSINPWHFCSKRSAGHLIFFGMRFYDPTLKRWLTPDPSGFADGPNLYLYVCNNPLRRLDLFGLFSEDRFGYQTAQIDIPLGLIPRTPILKTIQVPGSIDGTHVDYFLSCGHWHQIQFTPEEVHAGKLNLINHLPELIPNRGRSFGLVTTGNGINTNLDEFGDMCEATSKTVGGTLFIGLHNPTQGVIRDICRTFDERSGVNTPTVCRTRQFLATVSESLHKVNPDALWLYLAHSENGVISKRAIEGLSAEDKGLLQKELYMYAIGPAEPLPKNIGQSVINVYSKNDYITKWFAQSYIHDEDYDIRFVRCKSSRSERLFWIADHSFLAPTYQNAWSGHIRKLQEKTGFYQGGGYEQTR